MKHTYYDESSLRRVMRTFEIRYQMPSERFYELRDRGSPNALSGIPNFERHVWASFYREWTSILDKRA